MPEFIPNASLIKQIHDRLEKNANNALRAQGLTMMQVSVLLALHDAEDQRLSMKELERHFGIAQSTVTGIIFRLEQKGLVEALSDEKDKRIKLVHITRQGESYYADATFKMEETENNLLRGFSQDEQILLNRFLIKILSNLD